MANSSTLNGEDSHECKLEEDHTVQPVTVSVPFVWSFGTGRTFFRPILVY